MSRFVLFIVCIWVLGNGCSKTEKDNLPKLPTHWELSSIVGEPLLDGFRKVEWSAGPLAMSNVVIYAIEPPPKYDEAFLKRLADVFGIKGTTEPLPPGMAGYPGYWIKEPNPTNRLRYKSVIISEEGIGYSSGEDNHRWDLENHRPLAVDVPTAEEALERTLALLPVLGLSTNSLEHKPDGTLKWGRDDEGTTYTDRVDGQRKRYIRQMNITLYQKLPSGGRTAGVGTMGLLRAGFMSEGKLAELHLEFRRVKVSHTVPVKSQAQVISQLRKGKAWSLYAHVPDKITVTDCSLVYPQCGEPCKQTRLWPFYSVRGFDVVDGETNGVIVYVPIAW
jgi:hypothetical protein